MNIPDKLIARIKAGLILHISPSWLVEARTDIFLAVNNDVKETPASKEISS